MNRLKKVIHSIMLGFAYKERIKMNIALKFIPLFIILVLLSGCNDNQLQNKLELLQKKIEDQQKREEDQNQKLLKLEKIIGQDNINRIDVLTKNITLAENQMNNANVAVKNVQDEADQQSKLIKKLVDEKNLQNQIDSMKESYSTLLDKHNNLQSKWDHLKIDSTMFGMTKDYCRCRK
jgi:hypothetical protein